MRRCPLLFLYLISITIALNGMWDEYRGTQEVFREKLPIFPLQEHALFSAASILLPALSIKELLFKITLIVIGTLI